jgi:hypothetical protein
MAGANKRTSVRRTNPTDDPPIMLLLGAVADMTLSGRRRFV